MAALMAESPAEAWVTVFCQRTYNPYQAYGRRNPAFRGSPGLDGRLLDFKQRDARAIKSETAVLLAAVKQLDVDDAILVIIPGHEAAASNDGTPLACAAATIASATGFTAASDSLIRTTSIEKLAKGGNRSIEVHLNSMELSEPDIISGETVVILDDIVTSGNSIAAARQLLEVASASRIAAVAVGRANNLY